MKVSILVHNLSGNNLVRVYPIARTLQRFAEVEIVGFVGPSGVFPPYRDEFEYRSVPAARLPAVLSRSRELRRLITGDVLYAFKPNPLSLGVGLRDSRASGRPLVLDVEDFDLAFQYMRGRAALIKNSIMLWDPQSFTWLRHFDGQARHADHITVVSTFLKRRYGGTLLPHGADTRKFDPARFDRAALREKWGTTGVRTILFAGKVTRHKGVADLVELARTINESKPPEPVRVMVVGGQAGDPLVRELTSTGGENVIHVPNQPHAMMPEVLSQADMVVLPQKSTLYTQAQVPGKVFEAMAMAKPVIATSVSDLPLILADSGLLVPPEDDRSLADAVRRLLDNPGLAEELGQRARSRAIHHYSWDAMENILRGVFERFA